jgi:hypothetical protein
MRVRAARPAGAPKRWISPPSGLSNPMTQRKVVLLPAPLTPIKPVTEPAGTENETLEIPLPPAKHLASAEIRKESGATDMDFTKSEAGLQFVNSASRQPQGKQAVADRLTGMSTTMAST